MAQTARSTSLESREKRLRQTKGKRHYAAIHSGLSLCYRRGPAGSGTWSARLKLATNRYILKSLGLADDFAEADGAKVLAFKDAQRLALAYAEEEQRGGGGLDRKLTVGKAADEYLAWFRAQRKGVAMAESAIRAHIRPAFGDVAIAKLTSAQLETWLEKTATEPARLRSGKLSKRQNTRAAPKSDDQKRARRASANRVFSVLRAILNRAFEKGYVSDDREWRKVKPFKGADQARIRHLTDAESVRLVNACAPDLRALVRAALLTGARWGELAALRVSDVSIPDDNSTMYVAESKSGKPRHIPLNAEGRKLFAARVAGKAGDAFVFVRADGDPWGHNHHTRALNEACKVAKLKPAVKFHDLRHTYASHLAQAGIALLTISKLLGHADTRITARHYAHLADKTLATAVTSLPSFEPNKQSIVTEIKGTRVA